MTTTASGTAVSGTAVSSTAVSRTAVSQAVRAKVAQYLEGALGRPVDDSVPDDTALSDLGLDSLLTISVIVALLDDAGVDLVDNPDALETPSTIADLHDMAARFLGGDDTVVQTTPIDEQTEQLAFYEAKLAYEIDSWDLSVALAEGEDIVVVDGRSADAYASGHIPGAVSIPHRTITPESVAELSREPLYVAYCDGIGCNASTKTALKLGREGFRVKELIGGLDWWKRDGHPVEGAAEQACAVDGAHSACGCAG
ncbi:rhodanese-like domain-containing protein [Cellulomonas sp. CW35]|uniref:rhodanese-like domain-containing protein n=1 Tax=Cellulomonas sp. CW35 TaxID=3458249 RepID=UPI002280419D